MILFFLHPYYVYAHFFFLLICDVDKYQTYVSQCGSDFRWTQKEIERNNSEQSPLGHFVCMEDEKGKLKVAIICRLKSLGHLLYLTQLYNPGW